MDLIRYIVKAVVLEGLSVREVAAAHGVSRSWVYECLARYRAGGEQGLHPRSRRPRSSPSRLAAGIEDEIVVLRKDLAGQGLDAGPQTIAWHLAQRRDLVPSVATIWRVLRRRGLITPQPQKRPRSSYVRFCADLPNERWQMDITHWQLAGGASAEILNIIDDHSRFLTTSPGCAPPTGSATPPSTCTPWRASSPRPSSSCPKPSAPPATRNSPGPRSANSWAPPPPQRHGVTGTSHDQFDKDHVHNADERALSARMLTRCPAYR